MFSKLTANAEAIERELLRRIKGEVRFSAHDRALYSTDASLYQVPPIGVVVPASIEDVVQAVAVCAEFRQPILPRGGGTSLAGQATNHAIVIDTSAFCRAFKSLDVAARQCVVEPGITIDEVNRELAARKANLLFAPDPATAAQVAIGGAIGNNAAGMRSVRYGRTSENVAGVEALLTSGGCAWLEAGGGRRSATALRLATQVADVCRRYAVEIRERFPKTIRRNAGYGLDLILKQLDADVSVEDLDLSGLICGSEGTLAVVIGAKLKLQAVPMARSLAVLTFATLEEAIDAVAPIVATGATAVELLDDVVLDAARRNRKTAPAVHMLPRLQGNEPTAVLYVEHTAEHDLNELEEGFARLRILCPHAAIATHRDAAAIAEAWALRRAAEPLLHGIAADQKPQTFVEDNAVPLDQLPRFVREFKTIVAKHGKRAAYWAHASVGVLHVRPLIDVHDVADRETLIKIAVEVADLARDCGGVMSGEHGDGRIRGPLLPRFFGETLMQAFREIKAIFDPAGLLNPGNIVGEAPIESLTQRLRVLPSPANHVTVPHVETFFDYDDQHGFHGAVEMCNGAGVCRKTLGGSMCPSYRATLDERHSTRGRGNALRFAITGQTLGGDTSGTPRWNDVETIKTLDLCLSCKACKTECPSNVDVSRLKAEYTAQRYRETGAPWSAKLFGHVRTLNRLGSAMPKIANAIGQSRLMRAVVNRLISLAPRRSIPPFAPSLYRWFRARRSLSENRPVVILYADCFTTYNEPEIGRAAVEVLEACGYEVRLPRIQCCGRAMISTGLLAAAIASADSVLETLANELDDPRVKGIVVCEPSCLSAIKDDWLQLKTKTSLASRHRVADHSWLAEDFVDRFWTEHPVRPTFRATNRSIILHGHCHQKSLWGDRTSADALRRVAGDQLQVLPSGCCGMAGSFGYQSHRYDLSMRIGELSVFPPIRELPEALIAAPGTSCRHQIRDGTGREAKHPIQILHAEMEPASRRQ